MDWLDARYGGSGKAGETPQTPRLGYGMRVESPLGPSRNDTKPPMPKSSLGIAFSAGNDTMHIAIVNFRSS
jgi:hypothetical protein